MSSGPDPDPGTRTQGHGTEARNLDPGPRVWGPRPGDPGPGTWTWEPGPADPDPVLGLNREFIRKFDGKSQHLQHFESFLIIMALGRLREDAKYSHGAWEQHADIF